MLWLIQKLYPLDRELDWVCRRLTKGTGGLKSPSAKNLLPSTQSLGRDCGSWAFLQDS